MKVSQTIFSLLFLLGSSEASSSTILQETISDVDHEQKLLDLDQPISLKAKKKNVDEKAAKLAEFMRIGNKARKEYRERTEGMNAE